MRIANKKLKKIINEELNKLINEQNWYDYEPKREWGKIDYGSPRNVDFGLVTAPGSDWSTAHLPGGTVYNAGLSGGATEYTAPGGFEPADWESGWRTEQRTKEIPGRYSDWDGDPGYAPGYAPRHQPKNWSEWSDDDLGIYGYTTGLDDQGNITLHSYQDQLHPVTQLPAYKREMYRRWAQGPDQPYIYDEDDVYQFPRGPWPNAPDLDDWVRKEQEKAITDRQLPPQRRVKIPPR